MKKILRPFDKYEAAILLDEYLKITDPESKRSAIKTVSRMLRNRAINLHIPIDDSFRSEKGISGQMEAMAYAYSDGEKGRRRTTSLFIEIVTLYRKQPELYRKLLHEAKEQIGETSINILMEKPDKPELIRRMEASVIYHQLQTTTLYHQDKSHTEMKPIVRITIASSFGSGNSPDSEEDRMGITKKGIGYEYNTFMPTSENPNIKWSYFTSNPNYSKLFQKLAEQIQVPFSSEEIVPEGNAKEQIEIEYSDGKIITKVYNYPASRFQSCFEIIKDMIPPSEGIPMLMKDSRKD